MNHNLDEINAALMMGDKFIPPSGSKCIVKLACKNRPRKFRVFNDGKYPGLICFIPVPNIGRRKYYRTVTFLVHYGGSHDSVCGLDWQILKVIGVPRKALPFGEWRRP